MSWILSSRNLKRSIYCDGNGGYLVIKHDRGICNEKTMPPFAMKKHREGFNEIFPPIAIENTPPIATTAQTQQSKLLYTRLCRSPYIEQTSIDTYINCCK